MNFITIMILVCQVNSPKQIVCFDKGSSNLRSTDIQSSKVLHYYKCSSKKYSDCDMDYKLDGCEFHLKDGTISYSSYICS